MVIREAVPGDAAVLARLRFDFRAELAPAVEGEDAFLDRCRRWMSSRLQAGGAWKCWLALDGAVPLGAAWLQLLEKIPNPVGEPELHGYVTSLYVRADRRSAGVGSSLLEACLRECECRGADAAFLWPTPRSRPLYERHGFESRHGMLERRFPRSAEGPPG